MIYAAHQPNYLPWLGYFYKIAKADIFVILDDVQMERGGYQNRVQIKTPNGPQWLTQPIKHKNQQRTDMVALDPRVDWRTKHLRTIRSNYGRAGEFNAAFPMLEGWFADIDTASLAAANIQLIEATMRALGFETRIVLSSTLQVTSTSAERIVDIGKALGGTTYFSGHGAKKYHKEEIFSDAGITLQYSDFSAKPYPQLWGDFAPGLSILDALLNIGPGEVSAQLKAQQTAD